MEQYLKLQLLLATDVFSAEYLKTNPDLAGYDTSAFGGSILRVSGYEYWNVKRESGTSNVSLTLSYTDPGSGDYITVPADARIARWTGSTWQDLGNSASTGTTAGTVTSGAAVTNFTPGPFTFGSANLQTNALLDVILYTYYADTDSDTFGDAANSITSAQIVMIMITRFIQARQNCATTKTTTAMVPLMTGLRHQLSIVTWMAMDLEIQLIHCKHVSCQSVM